ncbi:MAG: tungstate ABC transporter [Euryarchaeota archaeon]|nr:tungstate ABC transporter [Euryarchaeota archaeon]|tara:strand:+ start:2319 stop:3143 length:825 start_codon:yes stop_codon:yes gene_type:complete
MNRLIFAILLLIFPTIQGCLQVEDENEDSTIRLATTTSLRDSGLLAEILPDFTQLTGVEVDVIAVGSGAAMTLAENNDVDVLIVHDPEREIQFIEDGFAENRTTFAWNRFVLLGPISMSGSLFEILEWIIETDQCFVSRGDESGTHQKEQTLWRTLSNESTIEFVDDSLGYHPVWDGYQSIGQGMGAAITISDELECWTISDRGTALYRQENTNLKIHDLQETILVNPYSILLMDNEHNTSTLALRDFLLSSASEIDNYKVNNETLFYSGQPNV